MSLYSFEEICAKCVHARWIKGEKRTSFDYCNINVEETVDHVSGKCYFKKKLPEGNIEVEEACRLCAAPAGQRCFVWCVGANLRTPRPEKTDE